MNDQIAQYDGIRQFVETLMDENGFAGLSEETRGQYLPQFMAEAERRIGLAVLPFLDAAGAEEFKNLVENEKATSEQLFSFWQGKVPNLDTVVKTALQQFATEFRQSVSA